jgi:hypothetical protein
MGATLPKEKVDDQLTCSDIELIKITWDSVKDKKTIGINLLLILSNFKTNLIVNILKV